MNIELITGLIFSQMKSPGQVHHRIGQVKIAPLRPRSETHRASAKGRMRRRRQRPRVRAAPRAAVAWRLAARPRPPAWTTAWRAAR